MKDELQKALDEAESSIGVDFYHRIKLLENFSELAMKEIEDIKELRKANGLYYKPD